MSDPGWYIHLNQLWNLYPNTEFWHIPGKCCGWIQHRCGPWRRLRFDSSILYHPEFSYNWHRWAAALSAFWYCQAPPAIGRSSFRVLLLPVCARLCLWRCLGSPERHPARTLQVNIILLPRLWKPPKRPTLDSWLSPALVFLWVLNGVKGSPFLILSFRFLNSFFFSPGTKSEKFIFSASSSLHQYIFSAPLFQARIRPSKSRTVMASLASSKTVAKRLILSACLTLWMSIKVWEDDMEWSDTAVMISKLMLELELISFADCTITIIDFFISVFLMGCVPDDEIVGGWISLRLPDETCNF